MESDDDGLIPYYKKINLKIYSELAMYIDEEQEHYLFQLKLGSNPEGLLEDFTTNYSMVRVVDRDNLFLLKIVD